ncbi:MAG: GNAT family N-acetyltransferase [Candidatus Omnitrophota bacterium]
MNIEFKKFSIKMNAELVGLFREVFCKNIKKKYFKWRFLENPIKKNLTIAALKNNKIIGFSALTPVNTFLNKKPIILAFSGTSMIHPEMQRKGLYTVMAEELYNNAYNQGVDCIVGYPNTNSHYGRKTKLNWKDIYEIPTFSLFLDNYSKNTIKNDRAAEIDFNASVSKNIDKFVDININRYPIYFKRNFQFYKWRFINHPFNKYFFIEAKKNNKTAGLITFKYYKNGLSSEVDILDLLYDYKSDMFMNWINQVILYFKRRNVKRINIWMNTNTLLHDKLECFGFENSCPITYLSYHSRKNKVEESISNYKNWNISMCDSDIF